MIIRTLSTSLIAITDSILTKQKARFAPSSCAAPDFTLRPVSRGRLRAKKGPLIYALSRFSHIVLFPINPSTVSKYRKAFAQSDPKDDPTDAAIEVEILQLHMSKLKVITPESVTVMKLAQLEEYRRKPVQDRVDLTNRITTTLKNYYPHLLDWFKEKDTMIFCDFLSRWQSLEQAKRARKQTLIDFFNQHNARYSEVNEERFNAIKRAENLTRDATV